MEILFAIIGVAVLAAVIFFVKKWSDTQKKPSEGQDKKTIADSIKGALKRLKEILGSDDLSYEEAMKYFIEHKNDSPDSVKGALLKEAAGNGFVITQVFLDKNNNVVGGVKRRVKRLDNELLNLFKEHDLIIVE